MLEDGEWKDGADQDEVEGEKSSFEEEDPYQEAGLGLGEVLSSLMALNPRVFLQYHSNTLRDLLTFLVGGPDKLDNRLSLKNKDYLIVKNKGLAYSLACDIFNHLKADGEQFWPCFSDALIADVQHKDVEIRNAVHFCISMGCSMPSFQPAAARVLPDLIFVAQNPEDFGKSEMSRYITNEVVREAEDNTIAAIFNCLWSSPALSQQNPQAWDLVLSKLPLQSTNDLATLIAQKLLLAIREARMDVIGDNRRQLPKICGILSDVFKSDGADDDLNRDIKQTFVTIPEDFWMQAKPQFKETQWKKLEKLLKDQTIA